MQRGVIKLLVEADKRHQLTQRERITFAFVAQTESSPKSASIINSLGVRDGAEPVDDRGQGSRRLCTDSSTFVSVRTEEPDEPIEEPPSYRDKWRRRW